MFFLIEDLAANGLKYYDVLEWKGIEAKKGMTVKD